MNDRATESIASGVSYSVTRTDGSPVGSLSDLVGDAAFLGHQAARHSLIVGTGALDHAGTTVRFYQKDPDHEGRDVRIWLLTASGDGVSACHAAAI